MAITPKTNDSQSGTGSVAASPHWKPPHHVDTSKGFSPAIACCFTVNYMLGTGFLTIPWAFVQGGLLLSAVLLVVVSILSNIAKGYLLETMARAEVMLDSSMRWNTSESGDLEKKPLLLYSPVLMSQMEKDDGDDDSRKGNIDVSTHSYDPEKRGYLGNGGIKYQSFGNSSMIPSLASPSNTNTALGTPISNERKNKLRITRNLISVMTKKNSLYVVGERKYEINALCRVFLGKYGLHLYTIFISMYIYCTLWAYASVFASSMAGAAPIFSDGDQDANYLRYTLLFAAFVVPMSCLEMDEQVSLQVFLTGCRFAMVALMVFTSTSCAEDTHIVYEPAPMVNFQGIPKMLPIITFGIIYHHSIPGLSNPVGDKRKLGGIFLATNIFTVLAYAFTGVTLGYVFGTGIEQSANLNWEGFHGGTGVVGEDGYIGGISIWSKMVGMFIVCFPALDVVSAFPLNAITLGNNLMGAAFGRRIHEVEKNRWIVMTFRILASVPPIILAIIVRKLGTITDYAGTTGFIITFCFPALLYTYSRKKASQKGFSTDTAYSAFSSSSPFAIFLFTFGAAMFVFVSVSILRG